MALTPGTRFGSYEIVALLGAGGMGEVYRAHDRRLGRDVALKLIPEAYARDAARLARLEQEARAVAALNHPNIVILHSIEESEGLRFLTMEYVEGEDLARLVSPGGMVLGRLIAIGTAIADALGAAHAKGIVHRDLKPANVMVTRDGRVKVLDFGVAKLLTPPDLESTVASRAMQVTPMTGAGGMLGTVPYMSPEQLGADPVDGRSDLFALGILLYELAAGRHPFAGKSLSEVSAAILRDTPPSLTAHRPDLPPDLSRIVRRCLEKEPQARYQAAREVVTDLESLRGGPERIVRGAAISTPFAASAPSVAVLPFVNLSPDPENEYFADGLSEELLNVLTKIRGLRVASRTSAFSFKGKGMDLPTVAEKLKVATILEGSVRKAGTRVRITAQLIHVATDSHLWSETYDRELDDIFAVQDDIAHSVVKELRAALLGEVPDTATRADLKAELAMAARGRSANAEAYRLYLEGRFFVDRHSREDLTRGIACLRRALEIAPDYAMAWALLSRAHSLESGWAWVPVTEGYDRARRAAERALALEPDLPEAHVALGGVRMVHDWDWKRAAESIARALELAPGNADVVRAAAILAGVRGRLEEAIMLDRQAVELDPVSVPPLRNLAVHCLAAGRFGEAEEAIHKLLERNPQSNYSHYLLGFVHLARGRAEEALGEFRREPGEAARLQGIALAHHAAGRAAESDAALSEVIAQWGGDSAYQIAQVFAFRGDADQAFAWLDRGYASRDPGLSDMKTDRLLAHLHRDPRWGEFLEKMGLAG